MVHQKSTKTSRQRLEPETYWAKTYSKFHYWVVAGIKVQAWYKDVFSYCVAEKHILEVAHCQSVLVSQ